MADKITILIVDDSADMRRTIGLVVRDIAGKIFECNDGSQALAFYAANRPDWVLMDIRMKNVDGLSATRQIKGAFPNARVVAVTVCKGSDMKEAAAAAGACAFVVKDDLLELRRILNAPF
ncbi:MAG TPA: response regulator transcription factor [Blastocatellia bacterium]